MPVYTHCFRTYSVYLSFRHGVLILYTPRHLPPQREARRLPPQSIDLALLSKLGVVAVTGRGYNPSVLLLKSLMQQSSSPSIRSEAPSFIVARAAKPLVFGAKHQTQNVVRQSRTNILPKIHRGAEKCARFASESTGEPRFALSIPQ